MPLTSKMKALLIQLPFPFFRTRKHWGNVPLAAGFLKSMAYKERLLDEIEIEILDEKSTNRSSDTRLIDLIIAKGPDVLGFSLYDWNSVRSLFIAKKVKEKLPHLKIIVGGSEVTTETNYILDDPVVDFGVLGEGEITFVEILKHLRSGDVTYQEIKGLFFRKNGDLTVNAPRDLISDLDLIPSPYLLGFINPGDYGEAWLENMRGCPFKCSYCAHGTRPIGYFSVDRIEDELKVIFESGVELTRFVNGTFINSPNFYETLERIKKRNTDGKMSFFAFLYAEAVTEKIADLLKDCNFRPVEIGLQSVNAKALESVNRRAQLDKFINGINLLKERKFDIKTDIIIAMPGETLADFKKTLAFLRENEIHNITPFVLFPLPGTQLRRDAGKLGIKYQPDPPYLTIETPHISKSEIKEAIRLAQGDHKPIFAGSLTEYCNTFLPAQPERQRQKLADLIQPPGGFEKVILSLDSSCQRVETMECLGRSLRQAGCQTFTVWFKTRDVEKDLALMSSFIRPIAEANPFLLWSIILETDRTFRLTAIEDLIKDIPSSEVMFDFCQTSPAVSLGVVLPWGRVHRERTWLEDLSGLAPYYWSLDISGLSSWKSEVDDIFKDTLDSGILLDTDPPWEVGSVVRCLKYLQRKVSRQPKRIFFRNLALEYAKQLATTDDPAGQLISRPRSIGSILSLDTDGRVKTVLKNDPDTIMDLIAFQTQLKNILVQQQ